MKFKHSSWGTYCQVRSLEKRFSNNRNKFKSKSKDKNSDKFVIIAKKGYIIHDCYELKNKKNNEDNNYNKPDKTMEAAFVENNPLVDLLVTNIRGTFKYE